MASDDHPLTIAMVAGEASGDNLGAALVRQIVKLAPNTRFTGIGGPAMIAEGFNSAGDMERLSVNGFVDPLLRLPELLKLLFLLRDRIVESEADCFVGIDFNFFNLLLAGMLRKRGVKTVQYVSPTVWAWRQGRIRKIRRNVDLMMTLYPFETGIYEEHGIPVQFVGHPKADEITPEEGAGARSAAREAFGINSGESVVAILPGSRSSEVDRTGRDFLETAQKLAGRVDRFMIPAANEKRLEQLKEMLVGYPSLGSKMKLVMGQSRQVMTAADVVLVNSGTATLEAMLLKKPMVMSYRLGPMTYAIVSRLVKTRWFALPNILAGKQLVPELIQDDADPEKLAQALKVLLEAENVDKLFVEFDRIHEMLKQGDEPGRRAAEAVLKLCERLP